MEEQVSGDVRELGGSMDGQGEQNQSSSTDNIVL